MTLLTRPTPLRSKAVWGPKKMASALLLLVFGMSTSALAAGPRGSSNPGSSGSRHYRQAPKAKPGAPSSRVKNYKFDADVERRVRQGNPDRTIRVIVTMQPGSKLPQELKRYLRQFGSLDIINSAVLDVPARVIKQFEKHPDIFQVHYDR